MRKAQKDPQGWLTNLTKTMMKQLRVQEWARVECCSNYGVPQIRKKFGVRIEAKLLKMTPAVRGEIADQGGGYLDGRCADHVDREKDGRAAVTEIALSTIILQIFNILDGEMI